MVFIILLPSIKSIFSNLSVIDITSWLSLRFLYVMATHVSRDSIILCNYATLEFHIRVYHVGSCGDLDFSKPLNTALVLAVYPQYVRVGSKLAVSINK